jgi:hypothetical protein
MRLPRGMGMDVLPDWAIVAFSIAVLFVVAVTLGWLF